MAMKQNGKFESRNVTTSAYKAKLFVEDQVSQIRLKLSAGNIQTYMYILKIQNFFTFVVLSVRRNVPGPAPPSNSYCISNPPTVKGLPALIFYW